MAKRKIEIQLLTYGIHSQWESGAKGLPRLIEATTRIPARVDIEFGFVVGIKGAKNQELGFCIEHPGILDPKGQRRAAFDGSVYVKTNDWKFYLGDTIWLPIADKLGEWAMRLEMNGKVIAEKAFLLVEESPSTQADASIVIRARCAKRSRS